MTCNLVRVLDRLELPAPAAVGMVLFTAILAKGGHLFWAIGGMIVFHALFIVAMYGLARFNERRAVVETVPSAGRPELSLVPADLMRSSNLVSSILPRDPQPAAPRTPFRKAA